MSTKDEILDLDLHLSCQIRPTVLAMENLSKCWSWAGFSGAAKDANKKIFPYFQTDFCKPINSFL